MITNRATIETPRTATQRALPDCRTIFAARSGVRPPVAWIWAGAVNRSAFAGTRSDGGRGTGRRCSGERSDPWPGWSVIRSDAADGTLGRDDAGLADGHGQRPEGDLRRVEGQDAPGIDARREAIHAPGRGPVLRPLGLDPEPVVARAVARAFHPEVLQARVRLAAQVRAALVQRPDVEGDPVAGLVLALHELLSARVVQDDIGPGLLDIGRESLGDRQGRVQRLDVAEGPDLHGAAEAAFEVRRQEMDRAECQLGQPEGDRAADRDPQQAASRDPLGGLPAERLDRLARERLRRVNGLDVVVAHLTARSGGRWSCC